MDALSMFNVGSVARSGQHSMMGSSQRALHHLMPSSRSAERSRASVLTIIR